MATRSQGDLSPRDYSRVALGRNKLSYGFGRSEKRDPVRRTGRPNELTACQGKGERGMRRILISLFVMASLLAIAATALAEPRGAGPTIW